MTPTALPSASSTTLPTDLPTASPTALPTAATAPGVPSSAATAPSAPSSAVRLLQLDGALCTAMGLAMAVGAGPVADLLGTSATGVVRLVGIALVVYGIDLVVAARTRWAGQVLRFAGVGNLGWEVASLAVAALADLSTTGRVLVAAQGVAVGALGLVQLRAGRR